MLQAVIIFCYEQLRLNFISDLPEAMINRSPSGSTRHCRPSPSWAPPAVPRRSRACSSRIISTASPPQIRTIPTLSLLPSASPAIDCRGQDQPGDRGDLAYLGQDHALQLLARLHVRSCREKSVHKRSQSLRLQRFQELAILAKVGANDKPVGQRQILVYVLRGHAGANQDG
jgi:hypothetical protein